MKKDKLILQLLGDVTLKQCMQSIEKNQAGFVVVIKEDLTVEGVMTDGDIRRALLKGGSVEQSAKPFLNRKFVAGDAETSRETALKYLDSKIRFLPILDHGKLKEILTLGDLQYQENVNMITRAKAPARISFGGGGTDLTPFFLEYGGAVLNATINLYSHATLKKWNDSKIRIHSHDFDLVVEADTLDNLKYDGKLDLIKAGIKLLKPEFGFELEIASDFPPSSGLGGSSVVLAAVIGCLNEVRRDRLNSYDIAELSFQAERIELKCSGGWQDQYASVFGGLNFMEFNRDRNEINSLRVAQDILSELEQRLILCYSGHAHPTNKIHESQRLNMVHNSEIVSFSKSTKELAYRMKSELLRGHVGKLGELLHTAWTLKRALDSGISTPEIDNIYEFARANGAAGGKILGAGGGGYFLFQSHRDTRGALKNALISRGLQVRDVAFDSAGLRSWTVRD
jgi:D-glycero-alpha-D-manno-heptose-7-phosphate kinase